MLITAGTNTFNGAPVTLTGLQLSGGTLAVEAPFGITNDFDWTGGTLDGDDTTTVNGALTISGSSKNFNGGTSLPKGTATWSIGAIYMRGGAVLANPAGQTLVITGDVSLLRADGSVPAFRNEGTLLKSGGTGTTTLNGAVNTDTAAGVALTADAITLNNTLTTTGTGPVTFTNAPIIVVLYLN